MYAPLPTWWTTAVRSSHTIAVEAEVWQGRYGTAGVTSFPLTVVGGRVDLDVTRAIARRADIEVVDPTGAFTPDAAADALTPYGNEIVLRRGVTWGTETFLVPLGVFLIDDVDVVTSADGAAVISISGADRSLRVARNRWAKPYTIPAGTNVAIAITDLLADRDANAIFDTPIGTDEVTPMIVFESGEGSDPWRDAQTLAESIGVVLDVDPNGAYRMRVPADPSTTDPVATYTAGEASVLLSTGKRLSAEGVYNGVIATGESSGVALPVSGEAWDTDPASPTYRNGPFGEVPYFYSSPLLRNANQAATAAATVLQRILGQSERVEWSKIVDPALDGYDVVHLTNPATGIDGPYVIAGLTYPLTAAESMSGVAQARRIG